MSWRMVADEGGKALVQAVLRLRGPSVGASLGLFPDGARVWRELPRRPCALPKTGVCTAVHQAEEDGVEAHR